MSGLIFLGTGCGRPTARRFNSSTAIEHDGELTLIDAGAPCTALLKKNGRSPGDITSIFITHLHSDHVYELPMLLREIIKSRHNAESGLAADRGVDLYVPHEGNPAIMTAVNILSGGNRAGALDEYVTMHSISHQNPVRKQGVVITPYANRNDGFESYSFRADIANHTLFFTGDLPGNFDAIEPHLQDIDILIAECAHLDFPAYAVLNTKSIRTIIMTHIRWVFHGKEEELLQRLKEQMPDQEILLAYDNLEIELAPACPATQNTR